MKKFIVLFIIFLVPAILFAQGGDGTGGGIWTIISIVFAAVTTLFAGLWNKVKGKLAAFAKLAKEGLDVVNSVIDALEDDTLTKEEVVKVKKEAIEFIGAWKAMIGKE